MPPSRSSSPSSVSERATSEMPLLRVRGLTTRIGGQVLHHKLNLDLFRGEVLALVGASGSGKSVLLRTLLGLRRPAAGSIVAFGEDITRLSPEKMHPLDRRWGVLFQDGALFSSLTVAENIEVPLREVLRLEQPLRDTIAALKLALVGLPP